MSDRFVAFVAARRAPLLLLALLAGGSVVCLPHPLFGQAVAANDLNRLNNFVQNSNSVASKTFREGRDLIAAQEWAKAAEKFNGFIVRYPKEKEVDAALFYLAYALKQQKDYPQANQKLEFLIKEFPRSGWSDEARMMRAELAAQLGNRQLLQDALAKDNEEIKIVALQSLFRADPERALAFAAGMLKPDSTSSRRMKEAAISLLGGSRNQQAMPLLLDIARTQPDVRLRQIAIWRIAELGGESSLDELTKIYQSTQDLKVKQALLHAYAQMRGPRAQNAILDVIRNNAENVELRRMAIQILVPLKGYTKHLPMELLRTARQTPAHREDNANAYIDELLKIYDAEQNIEVKRQLLVTLAESGDARVQSKLLAVAQNNDEPIQVRMTAIRRIGEKDSPQAVEMFTKFYDAQTSPEAKRYVLQVLGESKQKAALRKLMEVARADSSVEMRKQAVRLLGESKDPEALKFVEDLLK